MDKNKLPDPAYVETEKFITKIEREIKIEYRQAAREIAEKVEDYWRRYEIKNSTWEQWVRYGKKTQAQYRAWKNQQLLVGERWEALRDSLVTDLTNTSEIARSIALGYAPEVYAINHDFGTYEIETGIKFDTSYTLYSREAAEKIFRDNPKLMPDPGRKTNDAIRLGKIQRWEKRHIQSVAMQAILQGESIPDIATRLANAVCDSDRKAAIRNARTMMTNVQNAGRLDAYKRAEGMGIQCKKQWIATLDSRTRHAHRQLDGVEVELGDYFENEFGKIMYPGDPNASPANVWNCRCSIASSIKGHEKDLSDLGLRNDRKLGGMSYDEWKAAKRATSNPIDLPERKAESIRAAYIREYRGYGGPVAPGRRTKLDVDSKRKRR